MLPCCKNHVQAPRLRQIDLDWDDALRQRRDRLINTGIKVFEREPALVICCRRKSLLCTTKIDLDTSEALPLGRVPYLASNLRGQTLPKNPCSEDLQIFLRLSGGFGALAVAGGPLLVVLIPVGLNQPNLAFSEGARECRRRKDLKSVVPRNPSVRNLRSSPEFETEQLDI